MRTGDLSPVAANEIPPPSGEGPVGVAVSAGLKPLLGIVSILIFSGLIGASYALAWRAYSTVVARQTAQATEIAALRETVREHELSRQHVAERLESLQSTLQQNQQSTQLAIERLLEQLSSMRAELVTAKSSSKQSSKIDKAASRPSAKPVESPSQTSNPEGGSRPGGAEGRH